MLHKKNKHVNVPCMYFLSTGPFLVGQKAQDFLHHTKPLRQQNLSKKNLIDSENLELSIFYSIRPTLRYF